MLRRNSRAKAQGALDASERLVPSLHVRARVFEVQNHVEEVLVVHHVSRIPFGCRPVALVITALCGSRPPEGSCSAGPEGPSSESERTLYRLSSDRVGRHEARGILGAHEP